MTIKYGFYDSLNGDRLYNANDISTMFEGMLYDGVYELVGNALAVEVNPGTMSVLVRDGRAWFNNTWLRNTSTLIVNIEPSSFIYGRKDLVVLEFDSSIAVRANSIKVLTGVPAAIPIAPALANTSTLKQYALAEIYVGVAVSEILVGNITNKIGTVGTPYASSIFSGSSASDEAYDAITWDGSMDPPTKNAVRDKIETLGTTRTLVNTNTTYYVGFDIGIVTITIATPCVITSVAHGLSNGDYITFLTTGALPTGLTMDMNYYVVNKTADTFQVSLTIGGAAINTTGTQSGVHRCMTGRDTNNGLTYGITGSFATIQKMIDFLQTVTFGNVTITIQLARGLHYSAAMWNYATHSKAEACVVNWRGNNVADASETQLSNTSQSYFRVTGENKRSTLNIQGIQFGTLTSILSLGFDIIDADVTIFNCNFVGKNGFNIGTVFAASGPHAYIDCGGNVNKVTASGALLSTFMNLASGAQGSTGTVTWTLNSVGVILSIGRDSTGTLINSGGWTPAQIPGKAYSVAAGGFLILSSSSDLPAVSIKSAITFGGRNNQEFETVAFSTVTVTASTVFVAGLPYGGFNPTINLIAGLTYKIEVILHYTSPVAGGIKFQLGGSFVSSQIVMDAQLYNGAALSSAARVTAKTTPFCAITAVTVPTLVLKGTITPSTTGNFRVEFAQNVASGSTIQLAGSSIKLYLTGT
jgi:hypothetical protein